MTVASMLCEESVEQIVASISRLPLCLTSKMLPFTDRTVRNPLLREEPFVSSLDSVAAHALRYPKCLRLLPIQSDQIPV